MATMSIFSIVPPFAAAKKAGILVFCLALSFMAAP